jgi:hypothetical protein
LRGEVRRAIVAGGFAGSAAAKPLCRALVEGVLIDVRTGRSRRAFSASRRIDPTSARIVLVDMAGRSKKGFRRPVRNTALADRPVKSSYGQAN